MFPLCTSCIGYLVVPQRFGSGTEVTLAGIVDVTMKDDEFEDDRGLFVVMLIVGATDTTGGLGKIRGVILAISSLLPWS